MSKAHVISSEPIQAVYVTAVEVHAVPIQAEVISSQPYGHDVPPHYESNQINTYGPGPIAYGTPAYGPPPYGHASNGNVSNGPGSYQPSSYRPNYTHDNNGFNPPSIQQGPAGGGMPPSFQQGPAGGGMQQQFNFNNSIGTCRGCGRQFQRPANSHESSASYYRCQNCCEFRVDAFMCVVS